MMTTRTVGGNLVRGALQGRGRFVLALLLAFGGAACGESTEILGPPVPGSIAVTVVTTGFMKDDGYELFVNGETQGLVGANDEVVLSGLEPASYQVSLEGVADNCLAEAGSVAVEVVSEQTAVAALSVLCAAPEATTMAIRANRDRPDLDTEAVVECTFGLCPSDDEWDAYAYFDSQSDPQAVIRQNQSIGVEIAHLSGVTLETLTEEHYTAANFTTELIGEPFGPDDVVLIRTDQGNVYALGNPVEQTLTLVLTFDVVLIAQTP